MKRNAEELTNDFRFIGGALIVAVYWNEGVYHFSCAARKFGGRRMTRFFADENVFARDEERVQHKLTPIRDTSDTFPLPSCDLCGQDILDDQPWMSESERNGL